MKENNELFRSEAKQIVDMSFDSRIFQDHLTRDDMSAFEAYLAEIMQLRFETHLRCNALMQKIEQSKIRKQQPEQSNESSKEL